MRVCEREREGGGGGLRVCVLCPEMKTNQTRGSIIISNCSPEMLTDYKK